MKRTALVNALENADTIIRENGGERQVLALRSNKQISDTNYDLVSTTLADIGLSEDDMKFAANQRQLIVQSFERTISETIDLGRYLLALKRRLPFDAYTAFFDRKLFPFKQNFANKIIHVSRSVDRFQALVGDGFSIDRLPNMSVLYELSNLDGDSLDVAFNRGLISPTTTMQMMRDFKVEVLPAPSRRTPIAGSRALRRAKDDLAIHLARVDELRALIARLECA